MQGLAIYCSGEGFLSSQNILKNILLSLILLPTVLYIFAYVYQAYIPYRITHAIIEGCEKSRDRESPLACRSDLAPCKLARRKTSFRIPVVLTYASVSRYDWPGYALACKDPTSGGDLSVLAKRAHNFASRRLRPEKIRREIRAS